MRYLALSLALIAAPLPAFADITARFIEGAPKDRFVFENTGNCTLEAAKLTLDLSKSAGALVFDVTNAGAGVEVFQPFELVSGADLVRTNAPVRDGDKVLSLEVADMAPGAVIAFTIDVDDTLGNREITVNETEITGSQIRIEGDTAGSSTFNGTTARIDRACA